ncbi:unnamed protein product [Brassica rapa subsp. narinosa]
MASLEPRGHPQHNHLHRVSSFLRFTATTKLNLRLLVTPLASSTPWWPSESSSL